MGQFAFRGLTVGDSPPQERGHLGEEDREGLHSPLVWLEDSGSPSLRVQEILSFPGSPLHLSSLIQVAITLKQTNQFLQENTGYLTHLYTHIPVCPWTHAQCSPSSHSLKQTSSARALAGSPCPPTLLPVSQVDLPPKRVKKPRLPFSLWTALPCQQSSRWGHFSSALASQLPTKLGHNVPFGGRRPPKQRVQGTEEA